MIVEEIRVELARRRMTRRALAELLGVSYDRCIRIVNEYTEPTEREGRMLRHWLANGVREVVGHESR